MVDVLYEYTLDSDSRCYLRSQLLLTPASVATSSPVLPRGRRLLTRSLLSCALANLKPWSAQAIGLA
jgi:hypothetical protein